MGSKMIVCKACEKEIAKSAKVCPHCGAKNKRPIFTKWWFWVVVVLFIGIVAGSGNDSQEIVDSTGKNTVANSTENGGANPGVSGMDSVFAGDCGISATAEIGNNIINFPELTITITNNTDKRIEAIQFYAVPFDVYGDEIKGWMTQSKLYTDEPIAAGDTATKSYQLLEQTVKTVELYVYSVYFEDGTEWGNKDASSSKIRKEAPTIEVIVK